MLRRVLLASCVAVVVLPLQGQEPAPTPQQPVFRAETILVEVSAVVVDDEGNPVLDLEATDFEVREDGEHRELVGFRHLVSGTVSRTPPVAVSGARVEAVRTNTESADAPLFVLLLDDLNVGNLRTHRVIRGAKGLLSQIPPDALLGVITTSGLDGTALTLTAPGPEHVERVEAFRGQLLRRVAPAGFSSAVGTPCGAGLHNSASCGDPTRAARRLQTVESIARLLERAGSRRKVLFWVTEDMGATPIDPTEGRRAQAAALRAVLAADVAVYPVHPDELPFAPEPDPGGVLMLGKNPVQIVSDDLAGVTLDQMARESGGRWIVDINDHEVVLARVVRQNSASYMLAYESPRAREPGRHRIDVRVARTGVRVYARRGYIVPNAPAGTSRADEPSAGANLTDLLTSVVPHGQLGVRLLVSPQLADGRQGRALATVSVDPDTSLGQDVHLALVTFDEHGTAANQQTLRFSHADRAGTRDDARGRPDDEAQAAGAAVMWEVAVDLALTRGHHQLRVAAATTDGIRTGLVVERIEIVEPGRDLHVGVPMLLGVNDAGGSASLYPTLQRTFDAGHPLVVHLEVGGRPVAGGRVDVAAHLVAEDGTVVREGHAAMEPGTKKDRAHARAVVHTHGLPAGAYVLVTETRSPGREPIRHAIRVAIEDGSRSPM